MCLRVTNWPPLSLFGGVSGGYIRHTHTHTQTHTHTHTYIYIYIYNRSEELYKGFTFPYQQDKTDPGDFYRERWNLGRFQMSHI